MAAVYQPHMVKTSCGGAKMTEKEKTQVLAVRATGRTNMFDTHAVQRIAFEMDFYELVNLIEERPKEYVHFILTGEDNA